VLDKHGGRPGSAFPKAKGTPADKNAQGQFELDDILTHPQSFSKSNNFGGIDYYRPDGSGARYYQDGTFRGFLEPNI
jgi:filamentous hemagglutinin